MKKKDLEKLTHNLPLTPNILGRERYFNSSVLIPLVKLQKEYYILLQKRAKNIRQGGDICFPGGRVEESDKSFEHTALRETKEELGIKKKDINIIGRLDTLVTSYGVVVEPFVGVLKKKAIKNMVLDANEVEKTILVPLSFFKNTKAEVYTLRAEVKPYSLDEHGNKKIHFPAEELNLPLHYQKPWAEKEYQVWVYKYEDEVIWGLTALIINDLLKKY